MWSYKLIAFSLAFNILAIVIAKSYGLIKMIVFTLAFDIFAIVFAKT